MELSISKKNFLRGLARTHAVADRKSSMPILSNILISTDGPSTLRFAATDLYLAVSATAEAKVTKGGTVAVGARTLFDIVKNLPEGEEFHFLPKPFQMKQLMETVKAAMG